jgi:hypothetical protein
VIPNGVHRNGKALCDLLVRVPLRHHQKDLALTIRQIRNLTIRTPDAAVNPVDARGTAVHVTQRPSDRRRFILRAEVPLNVVPKELLCDRAGYLVAEGDQAEPFVSVRLRQAQHVLEAHARVKHEDVWTSGVEVVGEILDGARACNDLHVALRAQQAMDPNSRHNVSAGDNYANRLFVLHIDYLLQ